MILEALDLVCYDLVEIGVVLERTELQFYIRVS